MPIQFGPDTRRIHAFPDFHPFKELMFSFGMSICEKHHALLKAWARVFNPLTPKSDQDRISLYINNATIKKTNNWNCEQHQ